MASDSSNSFEKLSETNYTSWKGNMEARLKRKQLWRIVSGAKSAPLSLSAEYDAWCEKEDAASGEIFGMLSEGQKVHVGGAIKDDPKKMWEALKDILESTKPAVRFNTLDALFSLRLREGESFPQLTTRVSSLLAAVQEKRPPGYTIELMDQELFAMTLIRALPPSERSFRSALMLQTSLTKQNILEAFANEWADREQRAENDTASSTTPIPPLHLAHVPSAPNHTLSPPVASWMELKASPSAPRNAVDAPRSPRQAPTLHLHPPLPMSPSLLAMQVL